MNEQVERQIELRILVPLMERYIFLRILKSKGRLPGTGWEPDWERALDEFKKLDATYFPFGCD
jgi:hypothetical protein